MARIRSPNYPALSLPEAINRVKTIHNAERHLAAPKQVIAKHLGYNGLNGAALTAISAISKYGLIEEANGDQLKVSPLAMTILYPPSPTERATAIKESAFKPPLFTEIANEWGGAQPSDENLRSFLTRRNFAADAIERVIKAYRETIELVTRESGEYHAPLTKPGMTERVGSVTSLKTRTVTATLESGVSTSQIGFIDDRIEVSAILYDQQGIQKVIDRLNAIKGQMPEIAATPPKKGEAAN
jgi:hypothetical protein